MARSRSGSVSDSDSRSSSRSRHSPNSPPYADDDAPMRVSDVEDAHRGKGEASSSSRPNPAAASSSQPNPEPQRAEASSSKRNPDPHREAASSSRRNPDSNRDAERKEARDHASSPPRNRRDRDDDEDSVDLEEVLKAATAKAKRKKARALMITMKSPSSARDRQTVEELLREAKKLDHLVRGIKNPTPIVDHLPQLAANPRVEDLSAHVKQVKNLIWATLQKLDTPTFAANLLASCTADDRLSQHLRSLDTALTVEQYEDKVTSFLSSQPHYDSESKRDFEKLKQLPNQLVSEYAERFRALMKASQTAESWIINERFRRGLHSRQVRRQVKHAQAAAVASAKPGSLYQVPALTTLDDYIRAAITFEAHRTDDSDFDSSDDEKGPGHKRKRLVISRPNNSRANEKKWCSYHQTASHNDADCRSQKRQKKEHPNASSFSSSSSSSSAPFATAPPSSAPMSQQSSHTTHPARPPLICENCHKKGHAKANCWAKGGGNNLVSSRARVLDSLESPTLSVLTTLPHPCLLPAHVPQELKASDLHDSSRAAADSKEPTLSAMDVDPPADSSNRVQPNLNETNDKHLSLDDPDLFADIFLGDHFDKPIKAYVDSGASRSFIDKELADELQLEYEFPPETIQVEGEKTLTSLGVLKPTLIRCQTHMCLVRLTVLPHLKRAHLYLGRPELRKLHLVTWHLPQSLSFMRSAASSNALQPDEEIETYESQHSQPSQLHLDEVHVDDRAKYDAFMQQLQPLIDTNQQITGFANAPEVQLHLVDREPRWIHQYPIPEAHKDAVREQIQKWLSKGKIKPNNSLWNLPLTTALKKDKDGNTTGIRVCLDPRAINKNIIPDNFTIPDIRGIYNSFTGMRYFAEIDLEDAFLQLKLHEEDQAPLSFTFDGVQYSFVGAPYGVRIMSNVFQRTMSTLLADLDFVRVYLDNITITSRTWQEHEQHVRLVLERLNKLNMRISVKKFKVGRRSLRILGREISANGIRPDPAKVERIMKWPFPTTCTALKAFLGVVNYLRPHLRHLADLGNSLYKASGSQEDFDREVAQNRETMARSFELLKEAIAKAPLLKFPDMSRPFHVAPDASRVGIGAVLYQTTQAQDDVGDTSVTAENIIAITSRALTAYERNYATYKLELLGIVNALQEFRHFLLGRSFHLHTDHRALTYVFDTNKSRPLHPTLANWVNEIMEYDFTVTHVPGYQNVLPDHLSRLYAKSDAWGVPNTIASSQSAPRLKPVSTAASALGMSSSSSSMPALSALSPAQQLTTDREELMRLLGKEIVTSPDLRTETIRQVHAEGHYGIKTVVEKIYHDLHRWWPEMHKDVAAQIGACASCQKYTVSKRGFHPLRSPEAALPGDWWQIDLIHLPTSVNGYSYILVIIDLFTSYVLTRALKTRTAEETASHLLQIWADWGPPKIMQSDEGTEFVNQVVTAMAELANVELRVSTPHYKHSTGSVERVNRTIGTSLRKMLQGAMSTWDTVLPLVTHYYNTTTRSLTKTSPYALMFTRAWHHLQGGESYLIDDFDHEEWISDQDFTTWNEQHPERLNSWINEHQKQVLHHIYPAIRDNITHKRKQTADKFNASHHIVAPLTVGTSVMAIDPAQSSKHDQKWVGPYKIDTVTPTGTYLIRDAQGTVLRRAISQLKVIPDDDEKFQSWEVEKIIRHSGEGKSLRYLVKWKNFPNSQNSWQKPDEFDDLKVISDYWKSHAPKRAVRSRRRSK